MKTAFFSSFKLSWGCRTTSIIFTLTSVADLSKFKGGRLGLRRRHAESYEVRESDVSFVFFPLFFKPYHAFRDYKSWKAARKETI